MAVDFSKSWGEEIATVTGQAEYQTCSIEIIDPSKTLDAYDYQTGELFQVTPAVNSLALELIGFQRIIDNPNSTPTEVSDAEAGFILASADLYNELEIVNTPAVIVSATAPVAIVGSLWIKPVDKNGVVLEMAPSGWAAVPVDASVYSGQARFIPIRAGVFHGGEAQANASTIRSMRFQLPQYDGPLYIRKGLSVKFTAVPYNPSLLGRWATVTDDFQGSTTATRTFNASMDIDAGGPGD